MFFIVGKSGEAVLKKTLSLTHPAILLLISIIKLNDIIFTNLPIMKRFYLTLLSIACITAALAQTPYAGPTTQAFGKVDKADLDMTSCDFEKDANAEVLFDQGTVYFTPQYDLVFERHMRIKIFNDKGNEWANVKIPYYGGSSEQVFSGLQAETINVNNGAIEITKVDKKQIFNKPLDKLRNQVTFAFPNVKAGSIIEYKYDITSEDLGLFPDWFFQHDIPTRYSELSTTVPGELFYKNLVMVTMPYVKNTQEVKALANVPSLRDEPFMSSWHDNAQRIYYVLGSITAPGYMKDFATTWNKVGEDEWGFDDFGGQIRRKLSGEDVILSKAKELKTAPEKIAFIFDAVRDNMKWNDIDVRYTEDGTSEAWSKKTGNCTEINLMVCHLLQKAGINALPMLVSTRENGKVNPAFPTRYEFDKTVAYVPVDSANYYVLDATSKYNLFNEVPRDLLNTFGFYVDGPNKQYDLVFLQKSNPVRQLILINAEIKPDGKIEGTAQFNSFEYNRTEAVERYKTNGEKKYIDYLSDGDNNLKISSIKFENMEVDTLPLTQNINFDLNLSSSDGNYIYFNPNILTGLHSNPFLNENRATDIDFRYRNVYSINGIYKIPAGFKTDALPKSISMAMPDKSIIFKRIIAEQDGSIMVRYTISYQKSLFFKQNYPEIHEFYKKMHEMLDEQIVLKKG